MGVMKEQPVYRITVDGDKLWYLPSKGKQYFHREDGPAIDRTKGSGKNYWLQHNKIHREDGPAIELGAGQGKWFLNDNELPKEELEEWIDENDIDLSTNEGKMAFKLRWM